jgi:hypothetical protein
VTFDGSDFVLAWEDRQAGEYQIRAARVSPAGTVLDPGGRVVAGGPGKRKSPRIAWGGGVSLVVWEDSTTTDNQLVRCCRIDPSGSMLDSGGFVLDTLYFGHFAPDVDFDGAEFLVAFRYYEPMAEQVRGCRVRPNGSVVDPLPFVVFEGDLTWGPDVAASAGEWLVSWSFCWYGADDTSQVRGCRVRSDGAILDSVPLVLGRGTGLRLEPRACFDGAQYVLVWEWYDWPLFPDIRGCRVSPDGVVLDTAELVVSAALYGQGQPGVAAGDGGLLVGWTDDRNDAQDIYGTRLQQDGVPLDTWGIVLATGTAGQRYPEACAGDSGFLAVWEDWRRGAIGAGVYASRLDVSGRIVGPAGLPIAAQPWGHHDADLAFDGVNYLVAWTDCRNEHDFDIWGTRVSRDGTVLDPQGIRISRLAGDEFTPRLAFDGTNYLVVWSSSDPGAATDDIFAARVTTAGTVLDSEAIPVCTAAREQVFADVAFDGLNYLVAWEDGRGSDYAIYGARVSLDGQVLDPGGVPLFVKAGVDAQAVDLAFGSGKYLAAFCVEERAASWDIRGLFIDPAGAVPESAGFTVCAEADAQVGPRAASDRGRFLVSWEDGRTGMTSQLYCAWLDTNGFVAESGRFAGEYVFGHQALPMAEGRVLAVYCDWVDSVGHRLYGNYRTCGRAAALVGVEEASNVQGRATSRGATIVRAGVSRRSPAELLDAAGRRVMTLRPGSNDVSFLAPGVYFVRTRDSAGRTADSKVVVTR